LTFSTRKNRFSSTRFNPLNPFHPPGITDWQAGKFTLDANELVVVSLTVVVEPVSVDQPEFVGVRLVQNGLE
jgi:hypothetical protein